MTGMPYLAGLDGCKPGWIAIYKGLNEREIQSGVVARIEELFAVLEELSVVAIDIPIGLTESGPRQCDRLARRAIGPRASSVFPAPIRAVIDALTYTDASRISRERQDCGISQQSFAIYPKVRSVDEALRSNPQIRDKVYEVHPEVCFRAWNGGAAMMHPKKTLTGGSDRLRLVSSHFGENAFQSVRARHSRRDVADDDILDAFAALWTAERIAAGTARTLPEQPPVDTAGLPMRIVY